MEHNLIEVTSISRPDTNWSFTDKAGHLHRWHKRGDLVPATSYYGGYAYEVPTLKWVIDGVEYDSDGEPFNVGHSECIQCGEHIQPGKCADSTRQFIPGLLRP